MKRRDFLKSVSALAAGTAISTPAIWSAEAQSRKETLLLVTENGPNNLDIHGLGTNRPGYEASWNCYDRLISHGKKTLADGSTSYDRDKFVPELAEDMNIGDMSVTFKLKKAAKFQDGTPVTAKDVKWSFDRAVTVGGFPTVQMKAGSLLKKEQFVAVDDNTFRVDFIKKDRLTMPDLAVIVPGRTFSQKIWTRWCGDLAKAWRSAGCMTWRPLVGPSVPAEANITPSKLPRCPHQIRYTPRADMAVRFDNST